MLLQVQTRQSLTVKPYAQLVKLLTIHGWHVGQINEKARILIKAFKPEIKLTPANTVSIE